MLHGKEKRSRREKEKKGQTHESRKERPEGRTRDAKEVRKEVAEVRREVQKEVPEVPETQAALFARDWEDTMHRARRTQGREQLVITLLEK